MKLGDTMKYKRNGRPEVEAVVLAVRRTPSTIRDMETGEEWPGIQFQLRPVGSWESAFWTVTFPDKEHEYTRPLEPVT